MGSLDRLLPAAWYRLWNREAKQDQVKIKYNYFIYFFMKGKSSRRPKTTEGSAQKSGWSKLLKPSIVKWPATPQVSQKMRKRWIYIELITMFEWFRYCDVKPKRGRQSAMLPQGERENYWKSNRPNQNSPLQTNSSNLLMRAKFGTSLQNQNLFQTIFFNFIGPVVNTFQSPKVSAKRVY